MSDQSITDLLPEEICYLILIKLPIKSIVICSAVCKSWNSLIKSAPFISSHLKQSVSKPLYFLQFVDLESRTDLYTWRFDDDELTEHASLTVPYRRKDSFVWFGCCNGLVLGVKAGMRNVPIHSRTDLFLWNPNVRRLVMIPPPSDDDRLYWSYIGLGFDSSTDDYKVLTVYVNETSNETLEISLYSLNSNSWQWFRDVRFKSSIGTFGVGIDNSMYFLNGNFHLAAQGFDASLLLVLAFDACDGTCSEIMLPSSCFDDDWHLDATVIGGVKVCNGLLSVFLETETSYLRKVYAIWVMKEYGVEASWMQLAKLSWPDESEAYPDPILLSIRKNGDVILIITFDQIFLYNPRNNAIKHFEIAGSPLCYSVNNYIESLVLLDRGDSLKDEGIFDVTEDES